MLIINIIGEDTQEVIKVLKRELTQPVTITNSNWLDFTLGEFHVNLIVIPIPPQFLPPYFDIGHQIFPISSLQDTEKRIRSLIHNSALLRGCSQAFK